MSWRHKSKRTVDDLHDEVMYAASKVGFLAYFFEILPESNLVDMELPHIVCNGLTHILEDIRGDLEVATDEISEIAEAKGKAEITANRKGEDHEKE